MKATGIIRKMDELGRIVIPMELRRTMGIDAGTPIEVFTEEGQIIFKKYNPGCVLCGSMDDITHIDDRTPICGRCAAKISAQTRGAAG